MQLSIVNFNLKHENKQQTESMNLNEFYVELNKILQHSQIQIFYGDIYSNFVPIQI